MAKGKKKNKANKNLQKAQRNIEKGVEKVENDLKKAEKNTVAKANKVVKESKEATKATVEERIETLTLLGKENLKWIGIGVIVLVIGYLLMIGGKSDDPNVFDESKIYSFTRITLAPILVCVGFGIQMYGIFKGLPKEKSS